MLRWPKPNNSETVAARLKARSRPQTSNDFNEIQSWDLSVFQLILGAVGVETPDQVR
jgi:hypothetical protein